MTPEKLEPFTLEEWRKRPQDLRYVTGFKSKWSAEVFGCVAVQWKDRGHGLFAPEYFYALRLAAPKPKLVEVRIYKDEYGAANLHYSKNIDWSDLDLTEDQLKFVNLDTGEVIQRVGVEE